MNILPQSNKLAFGHKIFMDIGASNPKGTVKVTVTKDNGDVLYRESNGANSYVNDSVDGFENQQDFIDKVGKIIKDIHKNTLQKNKNGDFNLSDEDKKLSGVVVFVPGTTRVHNGKHNSIAFTPNLRDKSGNSLTNVNFEEYENDLKTSSSKDSGIDINKDKFNFIVTKDLGGTGMALAQILAKRNQLKEGDYITGIMTGGGLGSVDLKVKNNVVEIETCESSNYITGNSNIFDAVVNLVNDVLNSNNPQNYLEKLTAQNNKKLKEEIKVLGKLGKQGVSVKSYIAVFCESIGRPDLIDLLQKVGDARIVEQNKMAVCKNDKKLLEQLRSMEEFVELETTPKGKVIFELNPKYFNKEDLVNACVSAVNDYANSVSILSINKIDEGLNKIVLLGPFAHGINKYIKSHSNLFGGTENLSELIKQKVKVNIDEEHANLQATGRLMNLYKFDVICDEEINIPDNTYSGNAFLNPKFKYVNNRGNWFEIPLKSLKSSK